MIRIQLQVKTTIVRSSVAGRAPCKPDEGHPDSVTETAHVQEARAVRGGKDE